MIEVSLLFDDDFSFFLNTPAGDRVVASFHVTRSVKDMIEALGVPHVEVGDIRVNGIPVGFDYLLKDGDAAEISLAAPSIDTKQAACFIADVHVKTLARHLRMLGFDTLYNPGWDDEKLAGISEHESRILLSRDTRLLMRNNVTRGMYIRSTAPREQVVEVIRRYGLAGCIDPFKRCISCNGEITGVKKESLEPGAVPPGVLARTDTFYRCGCCGKYYWNGTHVEKMLSRIEEIRRETH